MNSKKIVTLSNTLSIISIIALIYWVFTFIVMTVFGLKVFRENITETFYLSILGILVIMFGALILNVMFNLTRIAEKHNRDTDESKHSANKILILGFIVIFPLIIVFLFTGDYLTAQKKESMLVRSADSIVVNNKNIIDELSNYEFTPQWINNSSQKLRLLSNLDKNYGNVSVIAADKVDGVSVFIILNNYYNIRQNEEFHKVDFVFRADMKQREYLQKVFTENLLEKKFNARDGRYELFYPIKQKDKIIILYFQDMQNYGKLGS